MEQNAKNRFLVRYKNEPYDISEFVKKHPGGINTLSGMLNSDIDYKFEMSSPHSDAAKYLIKEYRVKSVSNNVELMTNNNNTEKNVTDTAGQSDTNETEYYELNNNNKFINNVNNKDNRNYSEKSNQFSNDDAAKNANEILIQTDDSMEVSVYKYCLKKKMKNRNKYKFYKIQFISN